jgi:hypothetical protein
MPSGKFTAALANISADDSDAPINDKPAMLKALHKKPRYPRVKQYYSHIFWDEIEPMYHQTRQQGEASIKAVNRAIDLCWEAETQEFKDKLEKELHESYGAQLRDWDSVVNNMDRIAIEPEERTQ